MYAFVCTGTPQHTSHSASKNQRDESCPTCGAPTLEVRGLDKHPLENTEDDRCDGEIEQGVGCTKYLGTDTHLLDAEHEDQMRKHGPGGFAVQFAPAAATMFLHLQGSHGVSYEEAVAIMTKGEG